MYISLAEGGDSYAESIEFVLTEQNNPSSPQIGLFNDDLIPDIAFSAANGVFLMAGLGDGTFVEPVDINLSSASFGRSLHKVDLNQDGLLDLVHVTLGGATVFWNDGSGAFETMQEIGGLFRAIDASFADLNDDGLLDIVVGNDLNGGMVEVSFQETGETFGEFTEIATLDQPGGVATSDVSGDGRADIITANRATDTISIFEQNASGGFALAATMDVGDNPTDIQVADLNDDDKADLVITNRDSGDVSVFLGNGDGSFADELRFLVGRGPTGLVLDDIDNDGDIDAAIVDALAKDIVLLRNQRM